MCCIIALQDEIRRGMVTRVDRDYNALQRPLGVNKKLKIQVHTVNANTNKGGQIQGKIIGIRIHFSVAHKEKQNINIARIANAVQVATFYSGDKIDKKYLSTGR